MARDPQKIAVNVIGGIFRRSHDIPSELSDVSLHTRPQDGLIGDDGR